MMFPMVATDWKVHFHETCKWPKFVAMFGDQDKVEYEAEIIDPTKNSSQVTHDQLDLAMTRELRGLSKEQCPPSAKGADIVVKSGESICVVEVERSNHEKYLRDLLKIHSYLHNGLSAGVLVVPENHSHIHGDVRTLKIAQTHIQNAMTYGMWNPEFIDRFFLVSYKMRCAVSNAEYSKSVRASFIERANIALNNSK